MKTGIILFLLGGFVGIWLTTICYERQIESRIKINTASVFHDGKRDGAKQAAEAFVKTNGYLIKNLVVTNGATFKDCFFIRLDPDPPLLRIDGPSFLQDIEIIGR